MIRVGLAYLVVAWLLSWLFDLRPDAAAAEAPTRTADSAEVRLDRRRVAVLPFSNFSPNRDDEYFADGITEELTSVISRVSGLEVIARTSVMPYKTAPKAVSAIARELRAGSVLEGSIRRADDRVRVSVQLIDGSSEAHIWSEDYDRELRDIFAIQSSIARAVASALEVHLLAAEQRQNRQFGSIRTWPRRTWRSDW